MTKMRVALISDLHGNLLALDAVLGECRRLGVDRTVCLGDVATLGPHPREVLARLRDVGCPCILGNHDEFLLDASLVEAYTEAKVVVAAIDWCRNRLADEDVAFLRTFRRDLALDLGEGVRLYLFHGSPASHTTDLLATTPPDTVDQLLAGHPAEVYACGHTHIQMLRQHRGAWIVNPGSVGMPFREYVGSGGGRPPTILPHTEFAVVERDGHGARVTLHRLPLDRAALAAAAEGCDNPLSPSLAAGYRRAPVA